MQQPGANAAPAAPAASNTYWWSRGGDAPAASPALLTAEEAAERARAEACRLARSASGPSLWNAAGTYEERDWLPFARTVLEASVAAAGAAAGASDAPGSPGAARLLRLDKLTGDATCACTRGKLRYGYDLVAELRWEVALQGGGAARSLEGTLALPELSRDAVADGQVAVADVRVDAASAKASGVTEAERAAALAAARALRPALLRLGRELDAALAARVEEQSVA